MRTMKRFAVLASISSFWVLPLSIQSQAEAAVIVIKPAEAAPLTLSLKPDTSGSLLDFFGMIVAAPPPPVGQALSLSAWYSVQSDAPVTEQAFEPEPSGVAFPLKNRAVSAGYALFPAWWIDQRSDVRFSMAGQKDGRIVVYGTARPNALYSKSSGVIRAVVDGTPTLAHCIMVSRDRCLFGGIAVEHDAIDDMIRFLSFMMPSRPAAPAPPRGYVARLGQAMIDEITSRSN